MRAIWKLLREAEVSPDGRRPGLSHILIDRLGTSRFPQAAFLSFEIKRKRKCKEVVPEFCRGRLWQKVTHITFSIWGVKGCGGEETNGRSPVMDFSKARLKLHSVKCSIKHKTF